MFIVKVRKSTFFVAKATNARRATLGCALIIILRRSSSNVQTSAGSSSRPAGVQIWVTSCVFQPHRRLDRWEFLKVLIVPRLRVLAFASKRGGGREKCPGIWRREAEGIQLPEPLQSNLELLLMTLTL